MRKILSLGMLLFLAVFFLNPPLQAKKAAPEPPLVSEEASFAADASDRMYLQKLREMIVGARKTLDIGAETFASEDRVDDPVKHLIEDLITAQKKGVRVRLFLNTFTGAPVRELLFLRDNVLWSMRREGIEIHFVNPSYHLSGQIVIADGEEVLEGGPAWIREGLEKDLGAGALIHSPQFAEKMRMRLEFLPLWDVEQLRQERTEGGIPIPFYLLREMKYFPGMVNDDDGDAMKIYLTLLRNFYQTQNVNLTVAYDDLASEIPAANYYEKGAAQFQVIKALDRLATQYQLIEVLKKEADRMELKMIFPSGEEPTIKVPVVFFQEGYAKELSPSALYAYFVICYKTQISGESPVWLGSQRNVEQDFPMPAAKFQQAVAELRTKNLVEVFPFKLGEGYKTSESLEYRYLLNPVPTMSERLSAWSRLRDQFGDDEFKRARDLAGTLGEPEDPKVIAVYLDLLKKFRSEDVLSLTRHVAALPAKSTSELLDYLETLLENETQQSFQLGNS